MSARGTTHVNGILLLYHRPLLIRDAQTVWEHINAFEHYSRFNVWGVNTEQGFPRELDYLRFQVIVLHYSLFGTRTQYHLGKRFLDYLDRSKSSYKIAFFQDEYCFCQNRFAFLNQWGIDCVYTLLEPAYFKEVYQKYTNVPKLICTLPGYVDENMVSMAKTLYISDEKRDIDIGYRARNLPYFMGRGAQEKTNIALDFVKQAKGLSLRLEIDTKEIRRIYGEKWYEFIANCRGCLGVESGVSIFDLTGEVYASYQKAINSKPRISFEEFQLMCGDVTNKYEDLIPYRTISPRHFEAAAFRVCQILFVGEYSGIMKPMVHYIPLKKDFSNFEETVRLFRSKSVRQELTDNAYRDLIASEKYSYRNFTEAFDDDLLKAGFKPGVPGPVVDQVKGMLSSGKALRNAVAKCKAILHCPFPGRRFISAFVRPVLKARRKMG